MDALKQARAKELDSDRFVVLNTIGAYRREYVELMQDVFENCLCAKLHNNITDTDGWLELCLTHDNVIHPCSIRFVPVKTNGARSNVKRVVKGYDEVDTIQERIKFVFDHFTIVD